MSKITVKFMGKNLNEIQEALSKAFSVLDLIGYATKIAYKDIIGDGGILLGIEGEQAEIEGDISDLIKRAVGNLMSIEEHLQAMMMGAGVIQRQLTCAKDSISSIQVYQTRKEYLDIGQG